MTEQGPAVCARCRHHARGTAIDMRPIAPPPTGKSRPRVNPIRSGLQGGDFICAKDGLAPDRPDSVTGAAGPPSGPDCRDINPDGRCPDYSPGMPMPSETVFMFAPAVIMAVILATLAIIHLT